jgi:hypothetical protein
VKDRAALDERLAQALAAALVAELRAELQTTFNAVHGERPAGSYEADAGADGAGLARSDDPTPISHTEAR